MSNESATKSTKVIPIQPNTAGRNSMKVIPIASLKSHPRNQEFFDDMYGEEWESFKAHIAAHGVRSAITVGKDGTITSGHQRVRACKELGITEIPALIIDYKSEDEKLLDLISTNLKQRGVGNLNPFKLGACIKELERIYGIQRGGDHVSEKAKGQIGPLVKSQKQLMDEFKIEIHKWKRCKQMADMIPELQALVNTDVITANTALDIARKLPKEEQRKLISGLDPDSKYTAKQINAEIAALQEENKKLINQMGVDREKYNDAIKSKEAQIEADREKYNATIAQKDNQIATDREKYNNAVKKRDEKFNAERSQLTAEISQLNKEVDDLRAHPVKPADYDSTRKRMAMLNSENYELKDKIKRLQSEVDAYNNEAARFTKNSEEYKKLERKLEEKKKELEALEVEKNAMNDLTKLLVTSRDFIENHCAPVKFMKCFKLVGVKPVTTNNLTEIVEMFDKWCAEMHKVIDTVNRGDGADYVDVDVTEIDSSNVYYNSDSYDVINDVEKPKVDYTVPWDKYGRYA